MSKYLGNPHSMSIIDPDTGQSMPNQRYYDFQEGYMAAGGLEHLDTDTVIARVLHDRAREEQAEYDAFDYLTRDEGNPFGSE